MTKRKAINKVEIETFDTKYPGFWAEYQRSSVQFSKKLDEFLDAAHAKCTGYVFPKCPSANFLEWNECWKDQNFPEQPKFDWNYDKKWSESD